MIRATRNFENCTTVNIINKMLLKLYFNIFIVLNISKLFTTIVKAELVKSSNVNLNSTSFLLSLTSSTDYNLYLFYKKPKSSFTPLFADEAIYNNGIINSIHIFNHIAFATNVYNKPISSLHIPRISCTLFNLMLFLVQNVAEIN